jgi:parvulin-like peptidyl-prolyl isomerase
MKILKYITCLIFLSNILFAWEPYDKVIATVNTKPIIESEIEERLNYIKRGKNLTVTQISAERKKILDQYIEDILVNEKSDELLLVVNNKKINDYLMQVMVEFFLKENKDQNSADSKTKTAFNELNSLNTKLGYVSLQNIKDPVLKRFVEYVEKTENTSFQNFLYDIRNRMIKEQVMQVTIGASPPTEKEARDWYNANKAKLGFEVNAKHILIIPKGNGFKAEREASATLEDLRKRIIAGESFEKLAAQYSEDPGSKAKGGELGWVMLAELDPYFASAVYQMTKHGEISQPIKSSFGYHLIKYIGRRNITYEKVEHFIMSRLYYEKMAEQFQKWIAQRKAESEIIYHNK